MDWEAHTTSGQKHLLDANQTLVVFIAAGDIVLKAAVGFGMTVERIKVGNHGQE